MLVWGFFSGMQKIRVTEFIMVQLVQVGAWLDAAEVAVSGWQDSAGMCCLCNLGTMCSSGHIPCRLQFWFCACLNLLIHITRGLKSLQRLESPAWKTRKGTGPWVTLKTFLNATPGTISDSRLRVHKRKTIEKEVQGRWHGL